MSDVKRTLTALEEALPRGWVQFVSAFPPSVPSGRYRVRVAQTITYERPGADAGGAVGPEEVTLEGPTTHFEVLGPQLALGEQDVLGVFPPRGAVGGFGEVLPHVAFRRRALPWARTLDGEPPAAGAPPQPWLALLVLAAAEIADGRARFRDDGTVSDLRRAKDGIRRPRLKIRETPARISIVDLDLDLFERIAPRVDELRHLAHVRHAHAGGRAGARADASRTGWYPVVIAQRFPAPGENVACLVSFEGHSFEAASPGERGIRLVALHRWTFRHDEEQQDLFQDALKQLDVGPLRLPTASGPDAERLFATGATAMPHDTQRGDRLVSVYRGPLRPAATPRRPRQGLYTHSDEALVYDPEVGVFDTGYAVAWALGRLLGLQDAAFMEALFEWRRANRLRFHREIQAPPMASVLAEPLADLARSLRAFVGAEATPPTDTRPPRALSAREQLDRIAERSAGAAAAAGEPATGFMRDRLSALARLEGVPFDYLVPDARMLPGNALRLFHVDPDWVDALVEGALSPGRATSLDHEQEADRLDLVGGGLPPAASTGLLLRSAVIAAWPGLELRAFDAEGAPLALIRDELLAPDVRIAFASGVIARLELRSPPEALHFGADVDDGTTVLVLRNLGLSDLQAAAGARDEVRLPLPWRDEGRRVVDVRQTIAAIERATRPRPGATRHALSSADLALMLVRGAARGVFERRPR